jgi:ribosomal protein S18 acetylase RimI-like enzyme
MWVELCTAGVRQKRRRQGVAQFLLRAAEDASYTREASTLLALLVAANNKAARGLYERCGFELNAAYTDAMWLADAERGRVGRPRRLLMHKCLEPGT